MDKRISRSVIVGQERALTDQESVFRVQKAVELELEKRKAMNLPIAVFDEKDGKVYACYPDGTRIEMGDLDNRGGQ